jgi:hypothetical protein
MVDLSWVILVNGHGQQKKIHDIQGNENIIEQGSDENGKFYKIYYQEEN